MKKAIVPLIRQSEPSVYGLHRLIQRPEELCLLQKRSHDFQTLQSRPFARTRSLVKPNAPTGCGSMCLRIPSNLSRVLQRFAIVIQVGN